MKIGKEEAFCGQKHVWWKAVLEILEEMIYSPNSCLSISFPYSEINKDLSGNFKVFSLNLSISLTLCK